VDRSPDVLKRARALAARRRVSNISWKKGTLERLPIADIDIEEVPIEDVIRHIFVGSANPKGGELTTTVVATAA